MKLFPSLVEQRLQYLLPAVGGSAARKPHGDAAGQNALNDASVEAAYDGCRGTCALYFLEEMLGQ